MMFRIAARVMRIIAASTTTTSVSAGRKISWTFSNDQVGELGMIGGPSPMGSSSAKAKMIK